MKIHSFLEICAPGLADFLETICPAACESSALDEFPFKR
jgi:hypothetical protein